MIKICESNDFKIMEIKKILENNNIEVFEFQNYSSINDHYTVSSGGNFSIQLKVKKNDYLEAKNILKKNRRNKKLKKIDIILQLEQIKQLDLLIRSKITGDIGILSKQIGTSQRQILFKLAFLKNLNAKIKFSKEFNSYYYTKPFELLFQFSLLTITDVETAELYFNLEEDIEIVFTNKNELI